MNKSLTAEMSTAKNELGMRTRSFKTNLQNIVKTTGQIDSGKELAVVALQAAAQGQGPPVPKKSRGAGKTGGAIFSCSDMASSLVVTWAADDPGLANADLTNLSW